MKKILTVEGMKCDHCKARVEGALSALEGVKDAKVDLSKKTATVTLPAEVSDAVLKKAVEDVGFSVVAIEEKKGLFGK